MKKNITLLFMSIVFLGFIPNLRAQTTLYDLNTIQKIEIYFTASNWDYQLDTAKYGAGGYVIADWVKINGVQFNTAGVKYKGNSSYDSTYKKNPLHIELDNVISQSYQGIKDIKLANCYADPSMIRDVLSYKILGNYMIAPRANFAQVYINGRYIGLYANTESIGKTFCTANFNVSGTTFISCSPVVIPSPATKSNLRYLGADSTAYTNFYEIKSTYGWKELVSLCNVVTNNQSQIETVMNMDRVLWMLAFNSVLVNLDSYTGVFAQNYYLYKDANKIFNPIVWDLNMSFGGFPFIGSSNTSMGSLTVANMQQLTPSAHATDQYWPLINIVMGNPSYRKQYFAHLRTITNEMFANNAYLPIATQMQQIIDTAVLSDAYKFYTYVQFQNALTTNYPVLNYTVPGISTLMSARVTYLQNHSEFSPNPPTISSVQPATTNPTIHSDLGVQATVQNASAVWLGYRLQSTDRFTRIEMFDDGNHNDGAANDNIYGASFNLSSAMAHYYVVASNSTAANFMPVRAEHEFYSAQATLITPVQGEVVINEFLAKNNSGIRNEWGEYADWIELYNNTNKLLSMFGLYLSDNPNNPVKWAFPSGTLIQPNGYLFIWADERPDTPGNIHCNFKLSAEGESVLLSKNIGNVYDSYTFGVQQSDISMGRCPNGTGTFTFLSTPTPASSNCPLGVDEDLIGMQQVVIFPNPTQSHFYFSHKKLPEIQHISIINGLGMVVKTYHPDVSQPVSVRGYAPGYYVVMFHHFSGRAERAKLVIVKE